MHKVHSVLCYAYRLGVHSSKSELFGALTATEPVGIAQGVSIPVEKEDCIMSVKTKLNKTEEELVNQLLEMGVDVKRVAMLLAKKKAEPKKVDEELGSYKIKGQGAIEFKRWSDKEGKVYITQTRVLETGVRTKGFGIPVKEFKAYVSKLNSIADKLGEV